MTEEQAKLVLVAEGYKRVYVWDAVPAEDDPEHKHPHDTVLMILRGEIAVKLGDKVFLLKSGTRLHVPKNTLHSALAGSTGCLYVVGEGK